jgi:5-methyltetrahydrofolate--homocysteine methyltransferase
MRDARVKTLKSLILNKVLVIDGAMGTAIQHLNLKADDFGGQNYEGCNENLNLTRPDVIKKIHQDYLEAGADIIETNTFGGTKIVLSEYNLEDKAYEINFKAAQIAREIADKYSSQEKPRFVAGSMGPTTKAISVTGGVEFEELITNFYEQAKALYDGGVDYFLLETCQDTRNIKAALLGIQKLNSEVTLPLPIAVSATIEPMGTMLAGQAIEALIASLLNQDLLYLGLNCATGPEFMTDHIRTLAELSPFPVSCVPNAGLPDEHGHYLESPEMVGSVVERFLSSKWLNVIGGCCGTHTGHIKKLSELAKKSTPHIPNKLNATLVSGIEFLEINSNDRPYIVGERTNVIGSRKFKKLISDGKFEEATEIAKAQVKAGAHIIDICLANPDRNEYEDMKNFLKALGNKVKVPLMIDSTDPKVIELALTYSQGKAIINSINLEDGEERFEAVVPLAKKYGAAIVVGTIDEDPEQGMAITRQRKLEIAKRSYELLTKKYKISSYDIIWDPLVFPCGTGDPQYVGSALETIEGIRLIKEAFPETKTVLGISNVSFGLPEAGREVLNSVFLYHCVQAGLDLAIVNSEKLVRYSQINEEEKKLAEDLLFNNTHNGTSDPLVKFTNYFRNQKSKPKKDRKEIPLEERLSQAILEGSKEGLIEDLTEALTKYKPLDIINGPLMKGMDEVGRLFNANKLIVAEVLQSAEVMKAAVSFLEPYMEKSETSVRGTMILATVKGDVHDIGKNLVDIIFSNNGFKIINLGIKVPPEQILSAIKEYKPDLIGLSGLLVKSAQQMAITAEDLNKAGHTIPILVGGAALSQNFTDLHIAKAYGEGLVAYAKDAMQGLELAKSIMDLEKRPKIYEEIKKRQLNLLVSQSNLENTKTLDQNKTRSSKIEILNSPPLAPDYERHVLNSIPVQQIWDFINPLMLYTRHLGIKGGVVRKLISSIHDKKLRRELEQTEPKSVEIWDFVEAIKDEYRNNPAMKPKAVYQFFRAASFENTLFLYDQKDAHKVDLKLCNPIAKFNFYRQKTPDGLCLADFVAPVDSKIIDNICIFVTTVGAEIREIAKNLKEKGEYLKSHALQALAIESAEATAEWLHQQIRLMWGFPDPFEMTMMERFQAKYRGKRYSFGYPACPVLDDQKILFDLLKPESIGVQLTEGFMMDPESSVSALAFHHPQAVYFSVGSTTNDENEANRF